MVLSGLTPPLRAGPRRSPGGQTPNDNRHQAGRPAGRDERGDRDRGARPVFATALPARHWTARRRDLHHLHVLHAGQVDPRRDLQADEDEQDGAVSFMDSLWPIWDPPGSRYVTWAPWSCAATSNAVRVLVDVFSKINAMFFAASRVCS